MKKRFISILATAAVATVIGLVSCNTQNNEPIEPNKKNPEKENPEKKEGNIQFADPEFKRFCVEYATYDNDGKATPSIDLNGDKEISYKEAEAFDGYMNINVEETEYKIKSFEDLKYFPNIISLGVSSTPGITSIDLSHNTKIQTFTFFGYEGETIDLSACPDLVNVTVSGSLTMKNLDLSKNPKIEFAYVSQLPALTSLNMQGLTKIQEMIIQGCTALTDLKLPTDFSDLQTLTLSEVKCDYQAIVGSAPKLRTVEIDTPREFSGALDLSKCTQLERFTATVMDGLNGIQLPTAETFNSITIQNSKLVKVDLSMCPGLTYIDLGNSSELTALNIANGNNTNISFFNTIGSPKLKCLQVDETMQLPGDDLQAWLKEQEEAKHYWTFDTTGGQDPETFQLLGDPIPNFSYDCYSK